ncbi:hypothetical protein DYB26_016160 [Aphanomyces astaci]|uniref:HSF-type DNA-binding domain-containing protein n=1 Tax=Aphanomyces astaci TaxID=112090 RepID=A0A3R7BJT1_APHAT|nr:hypothetical protein DYB26_016160 [Aphanomyces astaci]
MQRLSAHGVEGMTDGEFRASFGDMVRFVQTLHAEVAEMKNLVKSLQVLSTTVRVTSCFISNLCTIQFAMILDTKVVELQATNQGGMQTAQGDDETKVTQGDDIDMPSSTPLSSSPRQQLLGTIHIELRSTYLQRLHNMLEHCPAHLASWTIDGTSFAIYDPHALEMHVLPQFFMTTKFTSFLRQLSLYRFKKTHYTASNGVMALRFQHKQFTRNDPNAVVAMVRRYRARPSQSKAQEHNAVSREELKAILIGLLESVRTLQSELSKTKASLLAQHNEAKHASENTSVQNVPGP